MTLDPDLKTFKYHQSVTFSREIKHESENSIRTVF